MSLFKRHCLFLPMLVGVFALLTLSVLAQSDPTGQKRVTGTYAITNATVFTSPGTVSKATVIIKNGLIDGVGPNLTVPINALEIKGDSLFVYAGFIDVAGDAGVGKSAMPERPSEFDPSNPPPHLAGITPEKEVLDDFSPEDEEIAEWRKNGFTVVQLVPQGDGMLPGKTAIVLYGEKESSNILASSTGLSAKFEAIRGVYPGTVLGVMAKWRELYQNAALGIKHQTIFDSNDGVIRPEKDRVLEAFVPVIEKRIPVIFEVSDELEIRRALNLQSEKGFRLILSGVDEGSSLIPLIKEAKAQVVLSLDLPEDKASKKEIENASDEIQRKLDRVKEAYKSKLELASVFEQEGIPFAFGTHSIKSGDFMKNIRLLIENGLSEEGALAALTTNAANILNMSQITGSIEKGNLANLVITTDSLFKKGAQVKHVFVDGHLFDYDVENKKKKGNDKSEEDELTGSWEYSAETPEGTSDGVMTIKKEEGEYKGKITFDDPEGGGKKPTPMKNIKRSGESLQFEFDVVVNDMHISVTVSGEISGNQFEGKMSIADFGSFPFRANKTPDSSNNI